MQRVKNLAPFLRKTPPQCWNLNKWLPPVAVSNGDDLIEKEINPIGVECLENHVQIHHMQQSYDLSRSAVGNRVGP